MRVRMVCRPQVTPRRMSVSRQPPTMTVHSRWMPHSWNPQWRMKRPGLGLGGVSMARTRQPSRYPRAVLKWEPVVQVGAHEQAAWLLQEAYGLGELHGAEGLVEARLNGTHLGLGRHVQPGTRAVHPAAARAPRPRPPALSPGPRCPACRPWARRAGPALQQVERGAVGRAEDLAAAARPAGRPKPRRRSSAAQASRVSLLLLVTKPRRSPACSAVRRLGAQDAAVSLRPSAPSPSDSSVSTSSSDASASSALSTTQPASPLPASASCFPDTPAAGVDTGRRPGRCQCFNPQKAIFET